LTEEELATADELKELDELDNAAELLITGLLGEDEEPPPPQAEATETRPSKTNAFIILMVNLCF